MATPWHIAHNAMRGSDHVKGKSLDRNVVRRVWQFARPYRRMIVAFLLTIILTSLIGIVPPLIFKRLIDVLRNGKAAFSEVNRLALLALAVALAQAALSVGQRW